VSAAGGARDGWERGASEQRRTGRVVGEDCSSESAGPDGTYTRSQALSLIDGKMDLVSCASWAEMTKSQLILFPGIKQIKLGSKLEFE
jgi:hypothetical protein